LTLIATAFATPAHAQDAAPNRVLFTNVNVFDGHSETLQTGMSVLVEDNLIAQVSSESISADGATVIDGGNRTLMPGLVDLHSHLLTSGDAGLVDIEANFTWVRRAQAPDRRRAHRRAPGLSLLRLDRASGRA
jgi:cytosine/adenosine deaminase-related metal-dependent hydrolase